MGEPTADFPVSVDVAVADWGPVRRYELVAHHPGVPQPAAVSVYRIGDLLIDSGSPLVADALVEQLAGDPPGRVLLTHHHEDHMGGLPALRRAFGDLDVRAPAPLLPWVHDPGTIPSYRQLYWGNAEPDPAARPFTAGERFPTAVGPLHSLPTPGHCPHHVGFALEQAGRWYLLTGDLLVRREPLVIFYEASAPDALASLRRLRGLGDDLVVLPSHPRPMADGAAALDEQAAWIAAESERVRQAAPDFPAGDYHAIAVALYGPHDPLEQFSHGEITRAAFVRSVLDPVVELPAERLPVPA